MLLNRAVQANRRGKERRTDRAFGADAFHASPTASLKTVGGRADL